MISVGDALRRVTAGIRPLPAEWIGVAQAAGRVLAEDVRARGDQPAAAVSAMDGYAVRAADLAAMPARLRIVGRVQAGGEGGPAMPLGAGEAVRIFTGAALPAGADTVVIQEHTRALAGERVEVLKAPAAGRHVRAAGGDFRAGDRLLAAGRRLDGRAMALAASGGAAWLAVRRRPRVAVLATGDELVLPGEPLAPGQIVSSNSLLIAAEIARMGALTVDLGIASDDVDALHRALAGAAGADLLVTLGGASVGDYDLVRRVLDGLGFDAAFAGVAMRPGKPTAFGRLTAAAMAGMPVLMLPGNPVSAGVTARLFLAPVLAALSGLTAAPATATARLATPLAANDERQDYIRGRYTAEAEAEGEDVDGGGGGGDDGLPRVAPLSRQDSAMLAAFAAADCLIIRPPGALAAAAGDRVAILPLD